MNDFDYAGDLSPQEAWEMLKSKKDCNLLDCRTFAEWQFVGIPDLSEINKKALFIEWQTFPVMQKNDNFLEQIVNLLLLNEKCYKNLVWIITCPIFSN